MSLVELTVPVNFLRLSKKLFEINLDFPTGPAQHCPTDSKAKESYFGTFEDPECPVVHSADSGLFVAVYCITAGAIIFTLLHAIHRRHRFRREARSLGGGGDAEAGRRDGALRVAFGEDMQAQGFQSSRLGSVALVALGCFYAQWLGLYLVVLLDYYWECELTGLNNMCFYGSYPVFGSYNRNSTVLFGTWLCSLAAYSHLLVYSSRLRNFYRLPCAVEAAQHVAILLPPEADSIVVPRPRWLVRQQRRLQARLGESRPRRWHTAPLHRAASGAAFVEFRCARYVLRDGRFVRAEAALVGATLSSLVAGEAGLAEERRAALLSEVGPNRIAFDVDPLGVALRKEFFSYFYLYQFQLYVVWLWFSYVFVALALISVVLLAGLANVAIARTNQRKIAALTRSATRCRVRVRDEWLTVPSSDLVPGDVVQVRGGDWVLPADLLLLSGGAVVNESSLTGESMPVRKLPADLAGGAGSVVYTPRLHGKHTLCAGTTVLQATGGGGGGGGGGGPADGGVTALVTATGIDTGKGELIASILYPQPIMYKYDEELPVVVGLLISFALACFVAAVELMLHNGASNTFVSFFAYGLFTISQAHPP